jgi:hypothetical protein
VLLGTIRIVPSSSGCAANGRFISLLDKYDRLQFWAHRSLRLYPSLKISNIEGPTCTAKLTQVTGFTCGGEAVDPQRSAGSRSVQLVRVIDCLQHPRQCVHGVSNLANTRQLRKMDSEEIVR